MTLTLTRTALNGKAVTGHYELPFERGTLRVATLENRDFLIPDGTYPLASTWSPRFKKFMPEIQEVPDRTGIRIHCGTIPEHSQGCILVNPTDLANTKSFINLITNYYENESLQLCVRTEESLTRLVPLPRNGD